MGYAFQEKLVGLSEPLLLSGRKVVLAATCGAGKTRMALRIASRLRGDSQSFRILVLAHGQGLLRAQFYEDAEKHAPELSPYLLSSKPKKGSKETRELLRSSLVVTLPHTIKSAGPAEIGHFDLVIVDEAHHFYFAEAGMVQQALRRFSPPMELLLTGTPSRFVAANKIAAETSPGTPPPFEVLSVAASELRDEEVLVDPAIFLAATKAMTFSIGDYEDSFNLRPGLEPGKLAAKRALDEVLHELTQIVDRSEAGEKLTLALEGSGASPSAPAPTWEALVRRSGKLMVATRNQEEAREVADYLSKNGLGVALSTSDTDESSREVERFRTYCDVTALVVVNRGILGFNYPNLGTVIDMSGSLNPDRIFQLLSRVVRFSEEFRKKRFIKLMPESLLPYGEVALSCASAYSVKSVYETFSGDYWKMRVPVRERDDVFFILPPRLDEGTTSHSSPARSLWMELPGFDLMTRLYGGDHASPVYAWTTFSEVRARLSGRGPVDHAARIRSFYENAGRLPSRRRGRETGDQHEERLAARLSSLCNPASCDYDRSFSAWAKERGFIFRGDASLTKAEIKAFYDREGRLPSPGGSKVERRLYPNLRCYIDPKRAQYCPEMARWAKERGWKGGKSRQAYDPKARLREFAQEKGRLPGWNRGDTEEYRLAMALKRFVREESPLFDQEVKQWADGFGYVSGRPRSQSP